MDVIILIRPAKKGFTLLEVLVAMALLSIITTVIVGLVSKQYVMVNETKEITVDSFQNAKNMQRTIDEIKTDLEDDGEYTGLASIPLELFTGEDKVKIEYYEVNENYEDRHLTSLVGKRKPKNWLVPSVINVKTQLKNNGANTQNISYYTDKMSVDTEHELVNPNNIYLTTRFNWYVSKPGFTIPYEYKNDTMEGEEAVGTLYPLYADDYFYLGKEKLEKISDLKKEYAGKHLLLSVRPVATSGKMGIAGNTDPTVFVVRPPFTDKLKLHLMAGILEIGADKEIKPDASGTHYTVMEWKDKLSNKVANGKNFAKALNDKIGVYYEDPQADPVDTYARYVKLENNYFEMTSSELYNASNGVTVFAVARIAGDPNVSVVSKFPSTGDKKNSWNLGFDGFELGNDSGTVGKASAPSPAEPDKFYIIGGRYDPVAGKVHFYRNDENPVGINFNGNINAASSIGIGKGQSNGSNLDITEVLVYNTTLGNNEVKEVLDYLNYNYCTYKEYIKKPR